MNTLLIAALRVVILLSLAGTLLVQVVMMPAVWRDLDGVPFGLRALLITVFVAGIATLQVCAICVWRLLTLVRRGAVFSRSSFAYVNVIIGAIGTASALLFGLAVLLAPGGIAPGIVGLICGASLVTAGVALIVYVLRMLLAQAVERETEASGLRSELSEVI